MAAVDTPWAPFLDVKVDMAIGVWASHGVQAGKWQPAHKKSEWTPSAHHPGEWGSSASSGDPADVVWEDVTCDLVSIGSQRGKDRWLSRDFPPGMLHLVLRDEDGRYTNIIDHALQTTPIRLGNRLRVQVRAHGDTAWQPMFYGYISDTPETATMHGVNVVDVTVIDFMGAFARATVQTAHHEHDVDERLNALLTEDEWPDLLRDIDTDPVRINAGDDAGKLLDELNLTARSGGGYLFMSKPGKVVYRKGDWLDTDPRATTTQGVIAATATPPAAGAAPVVCAAGALVFDKSDANVITRVAVGTRGLDAHVAYRVESSPAIARFGYIDYQDFDLLTKSHADLKIIGDRILAQSKDSDPRVRAVDIPVVDVESARWLTQTLIGDRIDVVYEATAGWGATLTPHVMGIAWRIDRQRAQVTFTTDDYKETP